MSIHGAYVARIRIRPHPNADRLAIGTVGGFQVVVGLDVADGELGLFFSSELKVSPEYADANGLRPVIDETGTRIGGGYFPASLRVRAQRFRGERSDGYYAPLSSLAFTGGDPSTLAEGDIITAFSGVPICEKYLAPVRPGGGALRARKANPFFREHVETEQLGYFVSKIKPGGVAYVTLKLHGTSGRTGYVLDEATPAPRWWQRLLGRQPRTVTQLAVITGTRRVVLGGRSDDGAGYYGTHAFRHAIEDQLRGQLHEGEVVYYEIVGWAAPGSPIMARHDFSGCQDKDLRAWGKGVTYAYGQSEGTCAAYVYRIVQTTRGPLGQPVEVELPWPAVKRRCAVLGLAHVPDVSGPISTSMIADDTAAFMEYVATVNDGPDPLDPSHPREGVVVRVENADGTVDFFKAKGLTFKIGEGIAKEAGAEDMEEAQGAGGAAEEPAA